MRVSTLAVLSLCASSTTAFVPFGVNRVDQYRVRRQDTNDGKSLRPWSKSGQHFQSSTGKTNLQMTSPPESDTPPDAYSPSLIDGTTYLDPVAVKSTKDSTVNNVSKKSPSVPKTGSEATPTTKPQPKKNVLPSPNTLSSTDSSPKVFIDGNEFDSNLPNAAQPKKAVTSLDSQLPSQRYRAWIRSSSEKDAAQKVMPNFVGDRREMDSINGTSKPINTNGATSSGIKVPVINVPVGTKPLVKSKPMVGSGTSPSESKPAESVEAKSDEGSKENAGKTKPVSKGVSATVGVPSVTTSETRSSAGASTYLEPMPTEPVGKTVVRKSSEPVKPLVDWQSADNVILPNTGNQKAMSSAPLPKTNDSDKLEERKPVVGSSSTGSVITPMPTTPTNNSMEVASKDSGGTASSASADVVVESPKARKVSGLDSMASRARNYTEVSQEVVNAEMRVKELEITIETLEKTLDDKQQELNKWKNMWEKKKAGGLDLIEILTDLVSDVDSEAKRNELALKRHATEEQLKLAQEIEDIQGSLAKAKTERDERRAAATEIWNRLISAEEQLKVEQRRFEKEKKELKDQLQSERERLNKIEGQFAQERERFQMERSSLQEQIVKLQDGATEVRDELSRLEKECIDLRQLLTDQAKKLEDDTKALTEEQSLFKSDKLMLQEALNLEKEKLNRTMSLLDAKQAQFKELKNDLEMKIVYEKVKTKDLASQIENEDLSFRLKKEELEVGRVKANLDKAEAQLEQESMSNERRILAAELEEQRQLRREKAKEMSLKHTEMRNQIMSQWRDEKRKARDERKNLTQKYKDKLAAATAAAVQKEIDLKEATKKSAELREKLNVTTEATACEIELLNKERDESALRYNSTLENRDGTIHDLRAELNSLYDDIYEREQTIAKYENNFTELLDLSMQILKRKVDEIMWG